MTDRRVAVIGAGVSGLTAVKALLGAGVPVEGWEQGTDVGGMWRYENDSGTSSAYRSLHIDSSKRSLDWPDHRVPDEYPEYMSHRQVLAHLEAYADRFDLRQAIRFGHRVTAVDRRPDGRWTLRAEARDGGPVSATYDAIVVANGHLSQPKWPDFPGTFDGEVLHSHHYRTAEPFDGRRVLVVGLGNSAVDIAVDLARHASQVLISTRRSAWVMPKYIAGVPTDRVLGFLVRRLKLPVPAARSAVKQLARFVVGDQERFGVPKPQHPIWREHATLSQELLPYIGHGYIAMKPNVEALAGDCVQFVDGTAEAVDTIIYATGYRPSFPFLPDFEIPDGVPPALYRRMASIEHPGLYFSGLVQPVGPTITLVEIQARWLAAVLSGRITLPSAEAMWKEVERHRADVAKRYLDAARYTLEVDFRSYAAELTADLGGG